ncbi:exopolysaccharide biosynthesis polyprenyl glycosylphosphotransferase [Leptospira bandrabouensis]|uniref:exopolysaccharide biosynthesis polyprenyl glycosylphosphotransferase n=1 Tax=Leptospira bandrabouensis TaxID=2484903 RepID=UPI001EEA82B2|nr:exopolysaccharide biosynthesis polyprenyl glycosylphosphotransferase [Leptospira bandrabouensis]MCG6152936.1 exopolysaccharide biosynthesis polyprenyl glycosylphosphotransferase [Leptospira bandrabouensis]MCW7460331.1 exopolysaccharide biosynthesis polyprenyl glycosylphosphotransferase [Leptospira bandrabouensis]MCW7478164.1 exopolysaccharide biosynthesis polyprenyl glycosylphosphotransferase [Leptospira bandrabouensis]MCW7485714.1 exopolysaccharide biosynthesis polyprenyl glycosylphosphotra
MNEITRRHSRWFERILLSYLFQFISGGIVLIVTSAIPIWGVKFWNSNDPNLYTSLATSLFSFLIATFSLRKLFRLPASESVSYVLPISLICFAFPIGIILFLRTSYSIQIYVIGFLVTLLWCYAGFFLGRRYRLIRYAILPSNSSADLISSHGALFSVLNSPDLNGQRYNAIVADFSSPMLSPEWEKFLAKCTLARIPVYSEKKIREFVTGRVKIDHLSENVFGSLLPSEFYETVKRWIDIFTAVALIPIFLPLFLVIAILIKLESKGPAFFIQPRMGFRGEVFPMLKFRSMYIDKKGSGFTNPIDDPRITKIGKFIRKYRIDELPQLFNILIGQMSFIGPRPESFELSTWYEKDVPFFAYRHVVRPGLSGWAQVEQGYAAEVEGMKVKLEYDFYYIKNFSFWLDLLITFKTIKTVFTGFGAR